MEELLLISQPDREGNSGHYNQIHLCHVGDKS